FQSPLPHAWICNLCGMVSRTSLVTGCLHVFCTGCYRFIVAEGLKCPVDAMDMVPDDIRRFVIEDAQQKCLVVCCLNAEHGCDFRGPVSDLERHYVNDCSFHAVPCKTCKRMVLHNKILEHTRSCKFQEKGAVP
ncbi:unnamed protein product, partial [Ixodes hexagonus]